MSDRARNRPDSKKATDDWLTPPELVKAAGPFDLDPCCYPRMPWRTANVMVTLKAPRKRKSDAFDGGFVMVVGDGLLYPWHTAGRVWCNPPYSDILPWAKKMAAHGNGMLLVPAKSFDTVWGQHVLNNMDAALFFKGRVSFHYPNGKKSSGGWGPSILAAYGDTSVRALERVRRLSPGVVLINADKQGETE